MWAKTNYSSNMFWVLIIAVIVLAYLTSQYWMPVGVEGITEARLTTLITGTPATTMDTLFSNVTVSSNSTHFLNTQYNMRNGIPTISLSGDSYAITINNSAGSLTGSKIAFAHVRGDATPGITLSDSKNYTFRLAKGIVTSG
jgi:hypothetical protein